MSDEMSKTFHAGEMDYNLSAILGMDVSEVSEVAPGFQPFPKGIYRWKVADSVANMEDAFGTITTKKGDEMLTLRLAFECVGVHQLANADAGKPEDWIEKEHRENVMFPNDATNENGQDIMMRVLGNLRYQIGKTGIDNSGTVQDILMRWAGTVFDAPTSQRKDKNDPDRVYTSIMWDKAIPVTEE